MLSALLPLVLSTSLISAGDLENGALLTYRGQIAAVKGDETARKNFELVLLVTEVTDRGAVIYWTVDENQRGTWPWGSHFGRVDVDGRWNSVGDPNGPSLLYDRGDVITTVPLFLPMFAPDKTLAAEASWSEGKLEYRVDDEGLAAGRDCWSVDVRSPVGHKRTIWVEKTSPLVASWVETVFMGTGYEYKLRSELAEIRTLEADELEKNVESFNRLMKLRDKLGYVPRTRVADWKDEQLVMLKAELPAIFEQVGQGVLAKIVEAAREDSLFQRGRSGAVAKLTTDLVGTNVMQFKMPGSGLADKPLSDADLMGNVTILHFWEYRDTPLIEPYGQVGYLDFLYRRRKETGLKVYGVAVDERLKENRARSAALQSIKKVKTFMNLSYPVLLDDGEVLARFGDPRKLGATLPLFVVVGPDGKILHYHAGIYEVNKDRGLSELDDVTREALANVESQK